MNKKEMINRIAMDTGLPKRAVGDVTDSFTQAVKDTLTDTEEEVTIAGFGTFTAKFRAPRKGRNPQTGEAIDIPAKYRPAFKPAKAFIDQMNA